METDVQFRESVVFEGGRYVDILIVRYLSVMVGKVEEAFAIKRCSELFGLNYERVKEVWGRRDLVLRCSDGEYEVSGELLRSKVRVVFGKLVDELYRRDFSGMSDRMLLETLKVAAQLDKDMIMMNGGGRLRDVEGNAVGIRIGDGSNVIIVPMPESAQRVTEVTGGRVISASLADSPVRQKKAELRRAKEEERAEDRLFVDDGEADPLEEIKDEQARFLKRINGDIDD